MDVINGKVLVWIGKSDKIKKKENENESNKLEINKR